MTPHDSASVMTDSVDEHAPAPTVVAAPSPTALERTAEASAFRAALERARLLNAPESRALTSALGGGVVAFVIGLALFWGRQVPLLGETISMGTIAIAVSLVTGAVSFGWAYIAGLKQQIWLSGPPWRRVLTGVALLVTHSAITLFAVIGSFVILSLAFLGLQLPLPHSATLVAVTAIIVCYATSISASDASSFHLARLISVLLAAGTLTAMLTASNSTWWMVNLSQLGGGGSQGLAFNGSLITAGVVMVVLTDRLTYDLTNAPLTAGAKVGRIRLLMIGSGVLCTLTGLFPVDFYEPIHFGFALSMLTCFGVLMLMVPFVIPHLPAPFRLASIAMAFVPMLSWILFILQSFTWTGMELVSALSVNAWLVIFARTVAALTGDVRSVVA